MYLPRTPSSRPSCFFNMRPLSPAFISTPPALTRLLAGRSIPSNSTRSVKISATAVSPASIVDLSTSIRTRQTTAVETLHQTLSRVSSIDPYTNAFLSLDVPLLEARAAHIDSIIASGKHPGLLAGVPIAIKDNICTKGQPTTAASRILDGFTPAYDATAVARLEAAGALILGKTNLDEFGMGSSTEFSAYGATKNPWDLSCVPGGSSGGSAAAVASRQCLAALGSDTGGSIRQPASYCGVTGFKPSYGRVSRHGLLAYGSSLDTVGPICHTVRDAALVMQVIAGQDDKDGTSLDVPVPNYADLLVDGRDLKGVTVGVLQETMGDGVNQQVSTAVEAAVSTLKDLGAEVQIVSFPRLDIATSAYYVLAMSEASANLARYDGVRYGMRDMDAANSRDMYLRSRAEGFGDEVKRRIMVGTYSLSSGYYDAYYLRAQRIRSVAVDQFKSIFEKGIDVLVSPVAPGPAFKIGEKTSDPVSMFLVDIMTVPASLAGLPALSVPCGHTSSGLPIGMQIMGPFLGEEAVLRVGHAFQEATAHHLLAPKLLETTVEAAV